MRHLRTHPRRARLAALAMSAGLALAACGADSGADSAADDGGKDAGMDHGSHGGHTLHDPNATPADELTDADVVESGFVKLDTAPPGVENVGGQAWLAQDDDGTTVTIELTGLEPGVEYVAHLHELACSDDNGGDHFAFDPDGPETPPNEVHLGFTADDSGAGSATVTNDRRVGDRAGSVVVHPVDMMDNRAACADF